MEKKKNRMFRWLTKLMEKNIIHQMTYATIISAWNLNCNI